MTTRRPDGWCRACIHYGELYCAKGHWSASRGFECPTGPQVFCGDRRTALQQAQYEKEQATLDERHSQNKARLERNEQIMAALRKTRGNISAAAALVGASRKTVSGIRYVMCLRHEPMCELEDDQC